MDLAEKKRRLLEKLDKSGYITPPVKDAMAAVPRESFVLERNVQDAYEDRPLGIGSGQTISAPHMNAMMCSNLDLSGSSPFKVLEIGTGSGYHATLCAELLKRVHPDSHVYTVERIPELATRAEEIITSLGYGSFITVITSDGSEGYPEKAPYDRILVTAAGPRVPDSLINQLGEGGIMLIPVGEQHGYQRLLKIEKRDGQVFSREICGVAFVPLVGKDGFSE